MRLILAAALIALPVAASAATYDELIADLEKTRAEIRALPLIKAAAYAIAINEYCFPPTPFQTDDLIEAGRKQGVLAETEKTGPHLYAKAVERAGQHLMVNYAACEPATAFVEEVVEAFPAHKVELDALAERFFATGKAISESPERIERCAEALRTGNEAGKASCRKVPG